MSSFIFIIGYNCPLIVNQCVSSFRRHHDQKVNIICSSKDAESVNLHKNVNIIADDSALLRFKDGHSGTAQVWANIINGKYGNYSSFINIDSDVIFLKESISTIEEKLIDCDLVGPRRSYLMNKAGPLPREFHSRPEVVSTYILGIRTEKIDRSNLEQKCAGSSLDGGPILDFFDPISFEILNRGGKIFHLDFEQYGSSGPNNSFDNGHNLNNEFDCGSKLIHFAGIGSGCNFAKNGNGTVPDSYADWAKQRYELYSDIFFGTNFSQNDSLKECVLKYINKYAN